MQRNFIFTFLLTLTFCSSCITVKQRTGDDYYDQLQYKESIPYYEYVLKKKYSDDILIKLANCYRITKNYSRSEQLYSQIIQTGKSDAEFKLYYAEALMQNGKYADAKKWFEKYLETNRLDSRVTRLAESCDSMTLFFKDTALYDIKVLKLNSGDESNYSPAYYKQGIVFSSNRPDNELPRGNKLMEDFNLFYAKKTEGGNWLDPELLRGEITSIFQEGPTVFGNNFTVAYVTRNNNDKIKIVTNKKNENVLKIYRFALTNNGFIENGEMPFNSSDYSVTHPALSNNGNTMYFIADMDWGYGGTDIYKSVFINGSWSAPKNLGKTINTPGNEMFPFAPNDSTLYFSSDGNFTLGGLDIYRSELHNEEWSIPENIGAPVNSSKDDFGLIADSTEMNGYFTSNRINNTDKIFSYHKSPPLFTLTGKIIDKATNKPIKDALLKLKADNGTEINIISKSDGSYNSKLQHNMSFTLTSSEKNYFITSVEFSTKGKRKSEDLVQNITIEKMNFNKPYLWKNITFDKYDFKIKPLVQKEIDRLYLLLRDNPGLKIELSCHSDSRGTDKDNFILTQKRADAIAEILFGKGIGKERVIAVGYGESKLINHCKEGIFCLEEEYLSNVRTEIKILENTLGK
jgi:outer membrane protein OmpA-like peptidoglycan-associated protein/tetratricopeptide (TPR) repeat protein